MENAFDGRKLALYQLAPIPSEWTYTPDQVNAIMCTVDTLLARCLHTWLVYNPLGILTVTISEHNYRVISAVANASLSAADFDKVTVLELATKGKRARLGLGIRHAKGTLVATLDDHISWPRNVSEWDAALLRC
jgi:glycosylphosphatidylinositol transamidase (GPIT) subunit GPI8